MGLRICFVTPFAWSQPHDVNEHIAGVARELRELGHAVTVLAPSNRAADLRAGRRALLDGGEAEVIAVGAAVPISRRSRMGVNVGARANLDLALAAALLLRTAASTSCTGSSRACRASRTSPSETRPDLPSRRSSPPTGSATRPGARSACAC
jgi:hypothetical protein